MPLPKTTSRKSKVLRRVRAADKVTRADLKHGVCPDCGRRGLLTAAGVCAAPRDVKCAQRRIKGELRTAARLD